MTDRDNGVIAAAPRPRMTRKAISSPEDVA